jgi:ribosome-binding protein aMBF1 (putative translation factor)
MPRGGSTFTKRQKEQTRQQKQREKAERRSQRKQDKPGLGVTDDMDDLLEAARAQAAMFQMGNDYSPNLEPTLSDKKPVE